MLFKMFIRSARRNNIILVTLFTVLLGSVVQLFPPCVQASERLRTRPKITGLKIDSPTPMFFNRNIL